MNKKFLDPNIEFKKKLLRIESNFTNIIIANIHYQQKLKSVSQAYVIENVLFAQEVTQNIIT